MGLPRDGVVVADEGTVFGVLEGAPVEERSGQADLLPLVGFGLVVSLQHYLNLTARSGHLLPSFRLTTTNAQQMKQTENHRSGPPWPSEQGSVHSLHLPLSKQFRLRSFLHPCALFWRVLILEVGVEYSEETLGQRTYFDRRPLTVILSDRNSVV